MSTIIRRAGIADIPHLATFNIAAWGGVADIVYENAIPGRTVQEIIEHRFSRSNATSSHVNGWIAEHEGAIAGGLHAFPMDNEGNDPEDVLSNPDYQEIVAPFNHLHVPGSFYIEIVAVYPTYQGRGVARQLIEVSEADAAANGFEVMSLHVFDENVGARHLYESLGYREAGRCPLVNHPSLEYGGDLLVMTHQL